MVRDYFINGEHMIYVKGAVDTGLANIQELGLCDTPIRVVPDFRHMDIQVNAWGEAPPEIQCMLGFVTVHMTLVHFDPDVLSLCIRESLGGALTEGRLQRAGARMGNGVARFASGNHFIGLNLASPIAGRPWRFLHSYLTGPPFEWPLGNERSLVSLNWRVVPYTIDPWNGGLGASATTLWDRQMDT